MKGHAVSDFAQVCEEAARAGGAVLLRWIGQFTVREKGPSDLVTQADLESQEAIRAVIHRHFPSHAFVGEEGPGNEPMTADYCWIVDPLDGTTNYVHQVPHYASSVALAYRGEAIAGCIFDPVNNECFTAVKGHGAFLNGRPIQVSRTTELAQALVAASFSARIRANSPEIGQFVNCLLTAQGVRRTGSAALNLCYLASGRFDAFWALSTKAWDVAAGVLIVQEAGGVVTDIQGQPFWLETPHPVAAATAALHEQFRALLVRSPAKDAKML